MYKTIVVGTDGSSSAHRAVNEAAALAELSGAELHIVTAMSSIPIAIPPEMMAVVGEEWTDATEKAAEEVVAHAKADLADRGIVVTGHVMRGDPADCLVQMCEDTSADLLVVGNKGMQFVRRFLLGSVADRCAHHAPCSVLIVHTT